MKKKLGKKGTVWFPEEVAAWKPPREKVRKVKKSKRGKG